MICRHICHPWPHLRTFPLIATADLNLEYFEQAYSYVGQVCSIRNRLVIMTRAKTYHIWCHTWSHTGSRCGLMIGRRRLIILLKCVVLVRIMRHWSSLERICWGWWLGMIGCLMLIRATLCCNCKRICKWTCCCIVLRLRTTLSCLKSLTSLLIVFIWLERRVILLCILSVRNHFKS